MDLEPTFTRAEVVLVYDRMDLAPVETTARATDGGELLPNWEASSLPTRLVLFSRSGSSIVVVDSRRTVIQTRYFAEFTKPVNVDLRRRNMLEKLKALYQLFGTSSFSPLFLGLIANVRVPTDSQQRASELKRQIQQAPISQHLRLNGHNWHDFLVRFSTEMDDDYFVTTQISWYEERVMSVFSGDNTDVQLRDWEAPVESSGIDIRIDVNNKRGLIRGRRKWSTDDFHWLVETFHDRIPIYLNHALSAVNLKGV